MSENRQLGWEERPIADLYLGLYDGPHATPKPSDSGPVFLGIPNVTDDGHLDLADVRHIAEDDFSQWTRRVTPQAGDIVFTYEATLNRYAIIPQGFRGCLGRRMALIRPNPAEVDTKFLYYYFFSKAWRDLVASKTLSGATVDRIPLTDFPTFTVKAPPLDRQRRIAFILSAYDDLIENCEWRIKVLDEMARGLYREWFVNFRFPGIEKVPGSDGQSALLPKTWKRAPLVEVAKITMGQSPASEAYNSVSDGDPFHQGVTDFGVRYPIHRMFSTAGARFAEQGDILFSVRAPVGRLNIAPSRLILGRGLSAIRHNEGHQGFLWEQLRAIFYKEDMIGNGAIFASVTKKDVESIETLVPDAGSLKRFSDQIKPIHQSIDLLDRQLAILKATRDLLLPRLLSGQLDVGVAA